MYLDTTKTSTTKIIKKIQTVIAPSASFWSEASLCDIFWSLAAVVSAILCCHSAPCATEAPPCDGEFPPEQVGAGSVSSSVWTLPYLWPWTLVLAVTGLPPRLTNKLPGRQCVCSRSLSVLSCLATERGVSACWKERVQPGRCVTLYFTPR